MHPPTLPEKIVSLWFPVQWAVHCWAGIPSPAYWDTAYWVSSKFDTPWTTAWELSIQSQAISFQAPFLILLRLNSLVVQIALFQQRQFNFISKTGASAQRCPSLTSKSLGEIGHQELWVALGLNCELHYGHMLWELCIMLTGSVADTALTENTSFKKMHKKEWILGSLWLSRMTECVSEKLVFHLALLSIVLFTSQLSATTTAQDICDGRKKHFGGWLGKALCTCRSWCTSG